eukprot:scaffold286661_cov26-Tisochrysis_lutea.AAC.13
MWRQTRKKFVLRGRGATWCVVRFRGGSRRESAWYRAQFKDDNGRGDAWRRCETSHGGGAPEDGHKYWPKGSAYISPALPMARSSTTMRLSRRNATVRRMRHPR